MAEILAGAQAAVALDALAREPHKLVALAPYPSRAGVPVELLAIGGTHLAESLLVDVKNTPALRPWLRQERPFAAHGAHGLAARLLTTLGTLPRRWACPSLSAQLLAGGVPVDTSLSGLCRSFHVAPPAGDDLAALCAWPQALVQLLSVQGEALREAGLTQTSKLEATVVAPLVAMEHAGMPLDSHLFEQRVAREQAQLEKSATTLTPAERRGQESRLRTLGLNFLRHVGPDGRIHATFSQLGTRTGRITCTAPNLQAIPTDEAMRRCFAPPAGRVLVLGDYAACELRILAEMSEDAAFIAALGEGRDVHAEVAAKLFDVSVREGAEPERRKRAKALGFGLIYGMGPQALARALDVELGRAGELKERFFASYPRVRTFLHDEAEAAVRRGVCHTLMGRRLVLDDDDPGRLRRLARNSPIQGTSADIIKLALAALYRRVAQEAEVSLVHSVHDEVVLEAPAARAQELSLWLGQQMRAAGAQLLKRVPMVAEVSHGRYWA